MTALPPVPGTNTYISYADANALATDRLHAVEWRAAVEAHEAWLAGLDPAEAPAGETVPETCRQALTTATAILDALAWGGVPTDPSQALAWPRNGMRDLSGASLPCNLIPKAVQTAVAELAFYLLSNEVSPPRSAPVQTSMVGQSMETYFATVADDLPPRVRRLIARHLIVGSRHCSEMVF
jgi:hypothetical protein